MTISVVFDPPRPSDSPAVFNTKAFTLVGNLNTFSTQANDTASDINDQVTDPGVVAIGADLIGPDTIGAVAANLANVAAVAGISANVTTVAGISADVTAVAANTANINAAVADLPSLAAKVSKTGDTMTGQLIVPSLNGGQQAGHRNKLVNGDFSQNVRTATSFADGAYCMDNWFVLTESGNVTRTQLTGPESGAINGIRLTQPDASPKRMGFGQVVESRSILQFSSTAMNLAARLRLSTGANIRYAVLGHTGTADVVTRDVVNNWSSATFTPSNFFIAGVNVISTGTIAPGAATWGEVSDWDALGASVKNVIVFVWTESQVAQNVTLDCSRIQYEPGVIATPHEWRHDESRLTSRFVRLNSTGIGVSTSTTQVTGCAITFDAPMVASPTVTLQNGTNALLDPAVATRTATAIAGSSISSRGVYVDLTVASTTTNKVHVLLGGAILISSEL